MGGILGGGAQKTDRGNQLAATQGEWNIFNYGLPTGQAGQTAGTATLNTALSTLNQPIQYWQQLLQGGRTAAAANVAPQTQSVLDQANATRNQQAAFGTNRTGGVSAQNRMADAATQKQIDDIVTQGLLAGQAGGAAGLTQAAGAQAGIGSTQLSNALSALGLSQDAINAILQNASQSKEFSAQQNEKLGGAIGSGVQQLLSAFLLA